MLKNVYYINLDHREDRKESVERQLNDLGWNYTRFPAIKHTHGAIGCTMSHISLLKMAQEKDLDYITIIEDDIVFTKPNVFKENLNKFLDSGIKYDVLFLGGNSYKPHKKINEFCIQTFNCQTTVGYIAKKHFYQKLIDNFSESKELLIKHPKKPHLYCLDMYWKSLQRAHKFYFIIPPTVTQLKSYSDIDKRKWNADGLMLNINKRK